MLMNSNFKCMMERRLMRDQETISECNDQRRKIIVTAINNVNAASTNEVNVVGGKTSIELSFDPNMPALEDYSIFDFSRNDEDDGAMADMNNLDTTIQVSPNPTTRIHKDHPLDQGTHKKKGLTMMKSLPLLQELKQFLAYASFKDFVVYQMDVKSAFLYGKIEEEVYVCQPPGFEDPDFPDRVYKKELCNAFEKLMHEKFQMSSMGELTFFLGLQVQQKKDDIFISKDKYFVEILKKFRFTEVKTASTPMETQKPLLKDENGEEVDVHMYRYQVNLKVSHLHVVKRIFRYLKGQPKLGLWYLKDSPFDLVAYTDSDYAGASLDRKFTTGGCQFLRCRLISWQCKKQTVVVNSTTEAEYVAALSCCGQLYLILLGKANKSVRLMMEKLFGMELELILVTQS
ncbi:putative ribonuclease H-like domain-containing protein [Tanacetum coccineum]